MLIKLLSMKGRWRWNYSKWKVDGDETILTTTKLASPPSADPIPECKKEEPQTEADIWYCSNYLSERVFLLFGIFHINSCNYTSRTKTKRFKLGQMISPCFFVFLYLAWKLGVLLNMRVAINWLIFVCCLFVCIWFEISISKVELHRCTGWISCMRKLERLIRTLKSEQTHVQPSDYLIVCKFIWIFKSKQTFYSSAGRGAYMFTEKLNVKE